MVPRETVARRKKIIVLGSTGSIGLQTLEVVRAHRDLFTVVALSSHRNQDLLWDQIKEFNPRAAALSAPDLEVPAVSGLRFFRGLEGLREMIRETEADLLVNGIAGGAGLIPSWDALETGKDLALANKETLVMAGELITALAGKLNRRILPVDSEHSAVFHLLARLNSNELDEIILTASGGPFRLLPLASLETVTIGDALRHPTWKMGKKITVDSATLANKALEVIEAKHFFGTPLRKIKVVIHPQSYVHSLVRTIDGSLYAQISRPDMRLPIQNALTYPVPVQADFAALDLSLCVMEFFPVEGERYPLLALGRRAAEAGGAYPVVFNAANEVAVAAFLQGEISFPQIFQAVEETLSLAWPNLNRTLDDVILQDKFARERARDAIAKAR